MRHTMLPPKTGRRGFTLVELLVAAALCVVVMYVLAEAFKAGTDTLSQLKSVAGLSEQLRVAETIIRRDLREQHLEDKEGNPVLVSDQSVTAGWKTPNRGFFKVVQVSQGTNEQRDGNGIESRRASDHWIQFTNKLSGRTTSDVFIGPTPSTLPAGNVGENVAKDSSNLIDYATLSTVNNGPATYATRWGEVTYFLAQTQPPTLMPSDATLPHPDLFVLYRRARAIAPPSASTIVVNPNTTITSPTGGFPELSGFSQTNTSSGIDWKMNTADTIADPQFRLARTPTTFPATPTTPTPSSQTPPPANAIWQVPQAIPSSNTGNYGADILLSNVISMRIQVLDTGLQYTDPTADSMGHRVWDTYVTNDGPPRILGVRVQLRVYDTKNMVTRQITIDSPL